MIWPRNLRQAPTFHQMNQLANYYHIVTQRIQRLVRQ
jgi:hypothetical protein